MNRSILKSRLVAGLAGVMFASVLSTPVFAHHSFAMYDQSTTKTLTGKLTRYVPGANHAQLIFLVLDDEGRQLPVDRATEAIHLRTPCGSPFPFSGTPCSARVLEERDYPNVRLSAKGAGLSAC